MNGKLPIRKHVLEYVFRFGDLLKTFYPPTITKPVTVLTMCEATSPIFAAFADELSDPEQLCETILAANFLHNQLL